MHVTLEPHIADDGTVFAQDRVLISGHLAGYLGHQPNAPLNIIATNYDDDMKEQIRMECERLKGSSIPPVVASPLSDEECEEALANLEGDDDDD